MGEAEQPLPPLPAGLGGSENRQISCTSRWITPACTPKRWQTWQWSLQSLVRSRWHRSCPPAYWLHVFSSPGTRGRTKWKLHRLVTHGVLKKMDEICWIVWSLVSFTLVSVVVFGTPWICDPFLFFLKKNKDWRSVICGGFSVRSLNKLCMIWYDSLNTLLGLDACYHHHI